jgi:Family of unknown function (DUF5908)
LSAGLLYSSSSVLPNLKAMPIVVSEVVISVEVTNQASGGAVSAPDATGDKQAIISECVERVLDILKQKEER